MSVTSPARRRLMLDLKRLQMEPPDSVSASPVGEDFMIWDAIIFGPPDTPFEDGTFQLKLQFTEEYPHKPPDVRFMSKLFHPNVYADGSICLDILQGRWSPVYDVASILTSIQSLLNEPNPNSPANAYAAQLYQTDKKEYARHVQAMVTSSWKSLENDQEGTSYQESVDPDSGRESDLDDVS